ncbi:MAG: hypothetical protein V4449_03710 [Patescibacteria group bacterium]
MGNNSHGVSSLKTYKRPHKTAKRLAAKKVMLATKASKKKRK